MHKKHSTTTQKNPVALGTNVTRSNCMIYKSNVYDHGILFLKVSDKSMSNQSHYFCIASRGASRGSV